MTGSESYNACPPNRDPSAKAPFFKELWIHKPHTKIINDNFGTAGAGNQNVSTHIP